MSKIFETTTGIVKMGNTISLNFPYSAWRNGRPESINGKPIRFSSNGQNHDYTIRISDAQAENMMLMFTTTPGSLLGGQTYTVTIYERDFPSSNTTEEWKPMSRTETIQRGTDTINRSDLLPNQSYTEQGRDGTELVEWEEKFVDGVSTGEIRNERRTTQISVINNKRYIGTKTEAPISPTHPEPNSAVIDFRNVNQIFYQNNEIQSVYYMGEKLWEKVVVKERSINCYYIYASSFSDTCAVYFKENSETISIVKYIEYAGERLNVSDYVLTKGYEHVYLKGIRDEVRQWLESKGVSFDRSNGAYPEGLSIIVE